MPTVTIFFASVPGPKAGRRPAGAEGRGDGSRGLVEDIKDGVRGLRWVGVSGFFRRGGLEPFDSTNIGPCFLFLAHLGIFVAIGVRVRVSLSGRVEGQLLGIGQAAASLGGGLG